MVNIGEMCELIQEWMAQPTSAVELARLYALIKIELEAQLDICMEQFTAKGETHD